MVSAKPGPSVIGELARSQPIAAATSNTAAALQPMRPNRRTPSAGEGAGSAPSQQELEVAYIAQPLLRIFLQTMPQKRAYFRRYLG